MSTPKPGPKPDLGGFRPIGEIIDEIVKRIERQREGKNVEPRI